ncbi:MAG: hypothetical protein AAB425_08595, partial [Bdellovibrionota bacterium]
MNIGAEAVWKMSPFGSEKNVAMKDPSIRIVNKKIITVKKFTMNNSTNYYVPVTTASRDKNSLGSLRLYQSSSYSFGGGDKFSVGLDTFEKVTAYSAKATGKGALSVYAGPNL